MLCACLGMCELEVETRWREGGTDVVFEGLRERCQTIAGDGGVVLGFRGGRHAFRCRGGMWRWVREGFGGLEVRRCGGEEVRRGCG